MFNIEQPVVLSRTPFLELERGRFSVPNSGDGPGDRRLVLEGAVLRLQPGHTASYAEGLSPLMQQLALLGIDQVLIRGATLRFGGDANSRLGPLDADLDLTNRSQIGLRGVAIFHGDALSFECTLSGEGDARDTARRFVTLTAKGENLGDVRFDGDLTNRSGLTGDLEARLVSPAALMRWLGVPVRPAAALRNVVLGGKARWVDGIFDLQDARVVLDGQKPATGALRVRHRNERPIIEGTLAFATLDLTRIGTLDDAGGQSGALRPVLATLARDLPAYLDVDADVRLSAASVVLRNGIRGRGAATVTVDRGVLTAELAEVEWAGGNKARLHLEVSGQGWRSTYTVQGRVDLAQAQDAVSPLFGHALVAGPAGLAIDLQGRGEGPNLLPGMMTGKVAITAGAGARSTLDPFKVAERTAARPARDNPVVMGAPQVVEGLDLHLVLSDRNVRIEQGQIRTAAGNAKLSGIMDRSTAALDLVLTRTPRQRSPKGQNETGEQSFAITGSWASPNVARLALP